MSTVYVNTSFVITNNQTEYDTSQIWVSFSGTFTNTGTDQTIGSKVISDFTAQWRSFNISKLSTEVPTLSYYGGTDQFTFSFNGFSGRVYINYGATPLSGSPDPSSPGASPYIVFEMTVLGETLPAPTPSASNMDLSYVDGVSATAATMIRNAETGAAILATSMNPVISKKGILADVAGLVPSDAQVTVGSELVRVKSSAADPSAYHDWLDLMSTLRTITKDNPLNVCSYTSPATGIPARYALSGALFGYSGAPAISGQAPGFELMQGYDTKATFTDNLNPNDVSVLSSVGITPGTTGVEISGAGTVSGSFTIYITEDNLNAGTGIYGNNPPYVVSYLQASTEIAYLTEGIVNDLGGRIVGDLMAGICFGWSTSATNIVKQANATSMDLYGTTFSATTVGEISTGEFFFLLSLAGAQRMLTKWIGISLDASANHYDEYLYAIAENSDAYGSGFTDRLQGYSNPDTYWYTANPPVIPGGSDNYETVGFVDIVIGSAITAGMDILLTNNTTQPLYLVTSEIVGPTGSTDLVVPYKIPSASTEGGSSTSASCAPYQASWVYSPDAGETLLGFVCDVSGPYGMTIIPLKSGTDADCWEIGESPSLVNGVWVVRFSYWEESDDAFIA